MHYQPIKIIFIMTSIIIVIKENKFISHNNFLLSNKTIKHYGVKVPTLFFVKIIVLEHALR